MLNDTYIVNCASCTSVLVCYVVAILFSRYDSRVKAMELDERPTEQYSDIGGLDKQIEEVQHPPTCSTSVYQQCCAQILMCVLSILLSSWWKLLCCR